MSTDQLEDKELLKLIEIVKSPLKPGELPVKELDEVDSFIITFNIKPGKVIIAAKVIYEKYKGWTKEDIILSDKRFFQKFSKKFTRRKIGGYMHYYLEPAPFDITLDHEKET